MGVIAKGALVRMCRGPMGFRSSFLEKISTISDKLTLDTSHASTRLTPDNMTGRTLTERLYLPV
jgi:hypothetical protein